MSNRPRRLKLAKRPRLGALLGAVFVAVSFAWCLLPARAEKVEQLKPQGYVNDFAGVLDEQSKAQLTLLCGEVDRKAGAQIAVVTVRSLEGVPPEEFSINLATRWGIGPKKSDRGVLILLAIADRQYRVDVGYGLESILPDGRVGGFGREMLPMLRRGDYGGALLHLTGRIAEVIAEDRGVRLSTRPPSPRFMEEPRRSIPPRIIGFAAFIALIVLLNLIGGVFRLLSGRGAYRRGSRGGGWWILPGGFTGGGGGGGSFGGGGGFGGFGGGGFGGGGAGGSW